MLEEMVGGCKMHWKMLAAMKLSTSLPSFNISIVSVSAWPNALLAYQAETSIEGLARLETAFFVALLVTALCLQLLHICFRNVAPTDAQGDVPTAACMESGVMFVS